MSGRDPSSRPPRGPIRGTGREFTPPKTVPASSSSSSASATVSVPGVRAIIFSPASDREHWIETELARGRAVVQIGRSVKHVVKALCEDPAPLPQVLVVDVDSLSATDVLGLHEIRERGWCGTIVALGRVAPALRKSLKIDKVLQPPFVEDALLDALDRHRNDTTARTIPLPLFPI